MNKYIIIKKPNNNFVKQKDIEEFFKTNNISIKNIERTFNLSEEIQKKGLRKSAKIRSGKLGFTKSAKSRFRNMNYKYQVNFD